MIEFTALNDTAAAISVSGRLDAHEVPEFKACLDKIKAQGLNTLYVNMNAVSFMDSSGLAAIVSGLKAARTDGGELYLIAPSENVLQVLSYTLLDKIIPIYESIEAAQA